MGCVFTALHSTPLPLILESARPCIREYAEHVCVFLNPKGIMWRRRLDVKWKVIYEETNFNYIPLELSYFCSHGAIVVLYCCSGLSGMLFQLIWNHVPCRLESCSILCGTKPSVKECSAIAEKYWCIICYIVLQKNWKRVPNRNLCLRVSKVLAWWKNLFEVVTCLLRAYMNT